MLFIHVSFVVRTGTMVLDVFHMQRRIDLHSSCLDYVKACALDTYGVSESSDC